MENNEFKALIKLLSNHGIECSKLVKTTEFCVYDTNELLSQRNITDYSCIDAAPFITMLFAKSFKLDAISSLNQLDKLESYDVLMNESFTDMTLTWFHINNDLGAHECNLVYISSQEIYFIDYYQETKRDKLFRVVKFSNKDETKYILKEALFADNHYAFSMLFDFQPSAEKDRYNVTTTCNIFKIDRLPIFTDLWKLWVESLPILDKDLINEKEKNLYRISPEYLESERRKAEENEGLRENIIARRDSWDKFYKSIDYDFFDKYQEEVKRLNNIYNEYVYQIDTLAPYYNVL